MEVTITWQSLVAAAGIIAALIALANYLKKLFGWVEMPSKQENEIKEIKEEQQLLVYGILACLRGLHEQGANGPVTEAIDKIEKHLNEKAHGGTA